MSYKFKFSQHGMPEEAFDAVDRIVEMKMEAEEDKEIAETVAKHILGRPLSELIQELDELVERYPKESKIATRLDNYLSDNRAYSSAIALVTAMLADLPESLGNAVMEKLVLEIRSNYELRRERARRQLAKDQEDGKESTGSGSKGRAESGN